MTKVLVCLGLGFLVAAALCRLPASAQSGYAAGALGKPAGDLVTHFQQTEGRPTTLTVIDPQSRAMAVYHLNPQTGAIELRSVRNFRWDLEMDSLNSSDPLPAEIRKMVEKLQ
jgi:hypothetical protein